MNLRRICVLSGGFDPVHRGHVSMFEAAKKKFDTVIVLLNSDEWLTRKKGKPFMTFSERKYILESFRFIDEVRSVDDADGTVVAGLSELHQEIKKSALLYFGNGGDRTIHTTPELTFCAQHGIHTLWGLGGDKVQSSSELIRNAAENLQPRLFDVDQDTQE